MPWAVAQANLMPVKDPGPQPTATASIFLIVKEADFNKPSITPNNSSVCCLGINS